MDPIPSPCQNRPHSWPEAPSWRAPVSLALATGLLLSTPLPVRAQAQFQRDVVSVAHGVLEGPMLESDPTPQRTYANQAWRNNLLSQFPAADGNRDGTLTESEAVSFHLKRVRLITPQGMEESLLPSGIRRWTERVPMRDGESLPTEIYLPPGEGPFPVVLNRTSRGRVDSALDLGHAILRQGYAFVGQDLTPAGDYLDQDLLGRPVGSKQMTREEMAAYNAARGKRNSGQDGHDAIEWIARQPWSNGRVAMTGYSEAAVQTKNAVAENPPHLALSLTSIGSVSNHARRAIGVRPGVRRPWEREAQTGDSWVPPAAGDARPGESKLVAAAPSLRLLTNDRTGWFDGATQGAIEEWKAIAANPDCGAILVMGFGGHGALDPSARLPPIYGDADLMQPELDALRALNSATLGTGYPDRMYYFLMGDATDPQAPGNRWKVTDKWPVPHEKVLWHLHPTGTLDPAEPEHPAALSYQADPGASIVLNAQPDGSPIRRNGPLDVRQLSARKDVLSFNSPILTAPVEITGEASAELWVSSDAPDTLFIAVLVDVYPDGYEWPIRDGAFMLRFRDDASGPKPARPGEIYRIEIPFVATAITLAKGHRLGVRICSSLWPDYERHPNTWDGIDTYADAVVAANTIHMSAAHPSRLIVPVVPAGQSIDYDPLRHDW